MREALAGSEWQTCLREKFQPRMGNCSSDCLGCGDTQGVEWHEDVAVITTLALGEWLRAPGTLAPRDKPPSVLKELHLDEAGSWGSEIPFLCFFSFEVSNHCGICSIYPLQLASFKAPLSGPTSDYPRSLWVKLKVVERLQSFPVGYLQ